MSIFEYHSPGFGVFGYGSLKAAAEEIKKRGLKKALIVADGKLTEAGITEKTVRALALEGWEYCMYSGFKPNPTTENVNQGAEAYRKEKCDHLISLGGGSAHDCAKAISVVAACGGRIQDYRGADRSSSAEPLIAVTTTAGTGSECTMDYVVVDELLGEKYGNADRNVLPILAVNDYELMMDMPPALTAGTGMDALTHALEAYVSQDGALISSELAASAMRLVFSHLERAVHQPDLASREGMSTAQFLAGLAFGNAGCGLVHSMSHQLSAVYDLPHGLCNAILMPAASRLNMKSDEAAARYARLCSQVFPFESREMDQGQKAEYLIGKIEELSRQVGTKKKLAELGVREDDLGLLAEKTLKDASLRHNIYKPSKGEIEAIFRELLE